MRAAPATAKWCGFCRPQAVAEFRVTPRQSCCGQSRRAGLRCRNRRLESLSIHFSPGGTPSSRFFPLKKQGKSHASLGFVARCHHGRDRTGGCAVGGGRARRLSRQHHHDLRELPFAEGAAGRDRRQGLFRRTSLQRTALRCDRVEHHARQGNRHRQLERRPDQSGDPHRQAAERRTARRNHADRFLSDPDRRRRQRAGRLPQEPAAGEEQGA